MTCSRRHSQNIMDRQGQVIWCRQYSVADLAGLDNEVEQRRQQDSPMLSQST